MENPTLGRIEAEYLNGVRSGNVRKKRLRNGNRRIRRDRASGMSYIDLGAKYELSRAILHQIINRRWRRPTGPTRPRRCSGAPVTMFGRTPRKCALRPREELLHPCSRPPRTRPTRNELYIMRSRPALKLLRRRASAWWTEIAKDGGYGQQLTSEVRSGAAQDQHPTIVSATSL